MCNDSNSTPVAGYDTLIEQNDIGVFELRSGTFTYVNEGFADVLEYPRDDLLGMSPSSIVAEDDRDTLEKIFGHSKTATPRK
jgi:PAS domain S-box-containing protein